ncbi:MAG: peptide-methionine (S)-S-oxide reductase MsrA [Nanoarchaeota archaeon]|nr:peptide-methionine (S)-S-oxide reductase MsrA [Nanoarchaeota archaeon]
MQIATFALGCFWEPEEIFSKVKGVISTTVGYMGGKVENPSYEQVCGGKTGHAEVVQIEFDPAKVSYKKLLETFWKIHDPTQLNRQGLDVGNQYRSVIFYHNEEQKKLAGKSKPKNAVTEIVPAKRFYKAEEYHQKYLQKGKGRVC